MENTDKIKELMEELTENLNEIFGDAAEVKCISGSTDDIMGKMMKTYTKFPIVTLDISRGGAKINVEQCTVRDVIDCMPKAISALLSLIPQEYRNDVLHKAIMYDMPDEGNLMNYLNEEEESDE